MLQHFGWTVTILDTDKTVDVKNRLTMNMIRINQQDVYKPDTEGAILHTAITTWNQLPPDERNEYTKDFDSFVRDYMSTRKVIGQRIKRIFITPGIRQAAQNFTATQWGRELFLETRWEKLINVRASAVSCIGNNISSYR